MEGARTLRQPSLGRGSTSSEELSLQMYRVGLRFYITGGGLGWGGWGGKVVGKCRYLMRNKTVTEVKRE